MKIRKILFTMLSVFLVGAFSNVANEECGKLVIAEQNWAWA